MERVGIAVIGRGLVGAAAARHLAECGQSVVLFGPDEPLDRTSADGPFSSHGDEGRITRIGAPDAVWADRAARSIGRYADIEARSGITFHHPVGLLVVSPQLDRWLTVGPAAGATIGPIDPALVRSEIGLHLPAGPAAFEAAPAGYIKPRRLVQAQTALAAAAGATVVTEAVTSLQSRSDGFELGGSWGSLAAERVLVATGAFGSELIGHRVAVERGPRTVALIELDPPAGPAGAMPSLIVSPAADDRLEGIYWVPPVPYPDGRLRLKIGGTLASRPVIEADELDRWFRGDGDPEEVDALVNCVRSLLPGTGIASITTSPCVVTATPSNHPTIEWLDDGLAVAVGGNGAAAKSSDELGRIAADLFLADAD